MSGIYLIEYGVKGIKNLEQWAELSFYKKTFSKNFNIQEYNVKAVYGANGAGKSGLITSVDILTRIIRDSSYLHNLFVQQQLNELINKKKKKLELYVEYLSTYGGMDLYCYRIQLSLDRQGKYYISGESLSSRKALSHKDEMALVYKVEDGNLSYIDLEEDNKAFVTEKTRNLIKNESFASVIAHYLLSEKGEIHLTEKLVLDFYILQMFAHNITTILPQEEDHSSHFLYNKLLFESDETTDSKALSSLLKQYSDSKKNRSYELSSEHFVVPEDQYTSFEKEVHKLYEFLHVFKTDLIGIEIENSKKGDNICRLIMCYQDYQVHAEFESNGLKKLIRLFSALQAMVNGQIVFIDEMDSNLHDVYLCALLEYLMQYGKGQLCFTTHNIGPMDVLKQNKKSIDFLSTDHRIYSWKTSGNYSPSKLYRNGMIEGSPFNVDAIDFIGILDPEEEE